MHCCNARKPCCLRSSSEQVCSQQHDAHCMNCELFSHLFSLTVNESATVFGGKETAQCIRDAHTKNSLLPWAKHHKIKNYCRLTHDKLCVNLAKAISGDNSVKTTRKQPRRRPTKRKRISVERDNNNASAIATKSKMPLGYRSCICGTQECKQTMIEYFRKYHDYNWPDKLFPWLYVGVPKRPRSPQNVRCATKGAAAQKRDAARAERLRRRVLFCRHLQLHDAQDISSSNGYVAFPVHFPLIW